MEDCTPFSTFTQIQHSLKNVNQYSAHKYTCMPTIPIRCTHMCSSSLLVGMKVCANQAHAVKKGKE